MHQQYWDKLHQRAMNQRVSPLVHSLFTDIMRLNSHFTAIACPLLNRQVKLHNGRWSEEHENNLAAETVEKQD